MSLVNREDMDKLRPAADSKDTAATAQDDIQLKAVAFAINSAANTGELRTVFQEKLRDGVIEQLISNGYVVQYIDAAREKQQAVISWKGEA